MRAASREDAKLAVRIYFDLRDELVGVADLAGWGMRREVADFSTIKPPLSGLGWRAPPINAAPSRS